MIVDLSFKTKILFWSGIVLGSMSVGVLSYAVVRYIVFPDQYFYSYCLHDALDFVNHAGFRFCLNLRI